MKLGITGGTGFIGQYFLKEFSNDNQIFVITSRDKVDDLYQNKNVFYQKADYNTEGFKKIFAGCDAVIHLGAKRSSKEIEGHIENYFDNVRVSEELFTACSELGITNVVNISSTAVYDTTTKFPFSEQNAVNPLSYYGTAKLMVENIAHIFNRKKNMKIKSLRIAQVIGVGERGGYMLSIFLERCLKQEVLNVYGKGESGREYIYVKDVARAINYALNNPDESGIYNIGSGILTTNLELAEAFCKIFENKLGYHLLTDKKEALDFYLMDVKLVKEKMGFETKYSLEDSLKDMKLILQGEAR